MSIWPNNCKDCGKHRDELQEPPFGTFIRKEGGGIENAIQCKLCHEKEVGGRIDACQKYLANKPDAFDFVDDIFCPNCGEKHEQDGETGAFYQDGTHNFDCGYCGEEFKVDTSVSYSYTSYKSEK